MKLENEGKKFQLGEDLVLICKCKKPMQKVIFPDIGLCWSCSCGEYVVIEDYEEKK